MFDFKIGDQVRLKRHLSFRLTPFSSPPILHKNFEAGREGKLIHIAAPGNGADKKVCSSQCFLNPASNDNRFSFPGSVVVQFYILELHTHTPCSTESEIPDYSVSFFGKDQIEKYLEKVK